MTKEFQVKVPASTSNLGPGFDSLSLALDLYNTFSFKEIEEGVKIDADDSQLPTDKTNLAYSSFLKLYEKAGIKPPGLEIKIDSKIPLAAGLGSSSTAIVGGLVAANKFLNDKYTNNDILNVATEIEGHPDNCAAALYGGMTISIETDCNVLVNKIKWPSKVSIIAITPEFKLETKKAREVLPCEISYKDSVFNVGRVSYLISCIVNENFNDFSEALKDKLHQPYRKPLIKGMDSVFDSALASGALGATISGAGPTLAIFSLNDSKKLEAIRKSVSKAWLDQGIKSDVRILNSSLDGALIV